MRRLQIILDPTVVLSALFARDGEAAQLLREVSEGAPLELLAHETLLDAYGRCLADAEVHELLAWRRRDAERLVAALAVRCTMMDLVDVADSGQRRGARNAAQDAARKAAQNADDASLALARSTGAVIVAFDDDLLERNGEDGVEIVQPSTVLEQLAAWRVASA